LGDILFLNRQFTQAAQLYQKADQATPEGSDYAVYQQALVLGLTRQYSSKLDLLNRFISRFPDSDYLDDALFELGKTYATLQQTDQAIESYTRLLKTFPSSLMSPKAGIQIGLIYYNKGAVPQAIDAYKQVIEQYPASQEARIALYDLKTIYMTQNSVSDFLTYVKSLKAPLAIETDEEDSLRFMAAENLLLDGKQEEARQAFEQYLTQFPNGRYASDCHYQIGQLLMNAGENEQAISHFRQVTTQSGHRYQLESLSLLSQLYWKANQYEQALASYNQLKSLSTDKSRRIQADLGILRCHFALNHYSQTITAATTLLAYKELDNNIIQEARLYRAKACLSLSQPETAKKDLLYLSTDVQSIYGAEGCYLLAELYYNQKQWKEAEKVINRFIQQGTPQTYWLARSFLLLSDICKDRKDYFQAKQYLLSLKENYRLMTKLPP
jgi:TolA-binding protein